MNRLACLYMDAFALQLLVRREGLDDANHAVAVVERDHPQGRLLQVNELARRAAILPGMRYGAALSLDADLRAGVVAPAELEHTTHALLTDLRAFSPTIEPSPEVAGLFWLDVAGLGAVYPSARAWAGALRARLRTEHGLRAAVVVGFRRFASYAVATVSAGELVLLRTPAEELARAQRIPLARLDLAPELRERLERLGIRTPGELAALPEHGLRERFGPEAAHLHRLARGLGQLPLKNHEVRDEPCVRHELLHPVDNTEQLLFIIKGMLPRLTDALRAHGEALLELELTLELDHAPQCVATVRPAEATLDAMQLVDLVRLKLDSLTLAAAVESITLRASARQPAHHEQQALFADKPRRDLAAANRALARVRAELGDGAVVRARLRDGHLPEAATTFEPLTELRAPKKGAVPQASPTPVLVRRILHHPIPLTAPTRLVRNDGWTLASPLMGTVVRSIGPWIVSGGWWNHADEEIHRSYHYVETQDGTLLWVFLDRRRRRWFLHGFVE